MEREDLDKLQDEANREAYGLRKAEERPAAEERELEHGLEGLDRDIKAAEERIEDDLRTEHWGRDPERPLSWREPPQEPDPA